MKDKLNELTNTCTLTGMQLMMTAVLTALVQLRKDQEISQDAAVFFGQRMKSVADRQAAKINCTINEQKG